MIFFVAGLAILLSILHSLYFSKVEESYRVAGPANGCALKFFVSYIQALPSDDLVLWYLLMTINRRRILKAKEEYILIKKLSTDFCILVKCLSSAHL